MKLKLDQRHGDIIAHQGPLLVTGGPGSGKTTIALLKARERTQSLKPGQAILFLSFSRAAVRQVLTRCKEFLTSVERKLIEVRTYHLFCLEALAAHGGLLCGRQVSFLYPGDERLQKSAFDVDWATERQRLSSEEGCYCFDLVAAETATLLEQCMAVKNLYADKYPLVIIDEFQDTDDDQWRIVQCLLDATEVVCLADPEQRIFEYKTNVDPQRLATLRINHAPQVYNLGGDNHRSADSGILQFADAVLYNHAPLPNVAEVKSRRYYPRMFESSIHSAVWWTFSRLRKTGLAEPSVAVLCRSNSFSAQLSVIISEEHSHKSQKLPPIKHDILWDADLSAAAAQVVASILEWSVKEPSASVQGTCRVIANFYRIKNAGSPSKSASENARKFDEAAEAIIKGKKLKITAVNELFQIACSNFVFSGDPVDDWLKARDVLNGIEQLKNIFKEARLIRIFRTTDAIGAGLSNIWVTNGNYSGAADLVKRILERERVLSADRDPEGCVVMTIHKAKGKEFDGVVLVEGSHTSRFFNEKHEPPPYDKSRRLLRVGITRARRLVYIVRPHNAPPLVQLGNR